MRLGSPGRAARRLAYSAWPLRVLARRLRPRAVILLYHRIGSASFDPFGVSVTPDIFARHLRLVRQHFAVESVDALLDRLPSRTYQDRTVVVTFDDGYADTLTVAHPIAASLGIPFTVFVTVRPVFDGTAFWWDKLAAIVERTPPVSLLRDLGEDGGPVIGSVGGVDTQTLHRALHARLKVMPPTARDQALAALGSRATEPGVSGSDARPLTPPELRALAALPSITIGAHSMTHPILAALDEAQQREELVESKTRLERYLGRPVTLAAYPFGKPTDVSDTTRRLAREAGYRAAFETRPRPVVPSADPYALPRLSVHNWSDETLMQRIRLCFGETPW